MEEKIVLKMPSMTSDGVEGINNGNIETYKNTLLLSLTKEELQNSTDEAIVDSEGKIKKVYVDFRDFDLERKDFPDYDATVNVFKQELDYWEPLYKNDKKAIKFLNNALKILNNEKIRCLRISDRNTRGLTGIDKDRSPWKNLVKNRGVSDKAPSASGSFGIGKAAAFACSELRTVFYNTVNIENEEAFQGALWLPGYISNNINYTGTGFYSLDDKTNDTKPIRKSISLDNNYIRNEVGMDKFILGFPVVFGKEELEMLLIESSIQNFLYAIFNDTLEVKINDLVVNSINLPKIINKYSDKLDKNTIQYYDTLKNYDKLSKITVFEDNDVEVYVKKNPDGCRRAAVVRKSGMKVFDKGNISGRLGFSAVIILQGEKVNGYFRKLEDSEHTKWFLDRAENRAEAAEKQNQIFGTVKAILEELYQEEYSYNLDADGVNEYLPLAYISGKKENVEGLNNEVESKTKARKKKKKNNKKENLEEEITYVLDDNGNIDENSIRIGEKNGVNPDGPNPNPKPNVDVDLNGDQSETFSLDNNGKFISKRKISEASVKYHLIAVADNFKLKFISKTNIKKGYLKIMISGEQESLDVFLGEAVMGEENLEVCKNMIRLENIESDKLYELTFGIKQKGNWALEVEAYESEK